jgi:hypothetical protein
MKLAKLMMAMYKRVMRKLHSIEQTQEAIEDQISDLVEAMNKLAG